MLDKFKRNFKHILNDHFDSIPINITVNINGGKFIVKIEDEDQMCFDKDGVCENKPEDVTDDLIFLCNNCINRYKQEHQDVLTEDGEGGSASAVSGDGGSVVTSGEGGVENNANSGDDVASTLKPTEPEINSKTVGCGAYVAYVCPGALSRRLFNKYYDIKKKKRKGK